MAIIKDAVARGRKAFRAVRGYRVIMPGPKRLLTTETAAVAVIAAGAILMVLLVYLLSQVPLEAQNAVLFMIVLPFAAAIGAALGFLLRRPGAGGWAFAATFLGALVGNLTRALLVDSRVYPWGPYEWEVAELTSLLNSLLIATPAGALGFAVGLSTTRITPSGELGTAALTLGIAPTLFGLVMMPVAAAEWVQGSPGTLLMVGIVLGGGLALMLGGALILWERSRGAGPSALPGGPGTAPRPPQAP